MRCYSVLRDVSIKLQNTTGHFARPYLLHHCHWPLWLICQRRSYWCRLEDPICSSSQLNVVKCGCKTTECINGGCSCLANKLPCTDICRFKACKNGKDDDDEVAESDSSQIVTFDDDLELESFCVWCAILKCKPYN